MLPPQHPAGRARALRRTVIRSAGFILACGIAASAAAIDYAPRNVGEWTVAASKDGEGCFLTRTYDRAGDTTLLLGLDADGGNHLSVLNANWSIKPKDRMLLDFRLSNGGYAKHAAVGLRSDGKQGFVTSFEPKFPTYFARSNDLHIARGDVPVERLNLAGSGAAIAELRKCVAMQRSEAKAAKTRKARADDIPEDPFAPAASRRSRK